MKRTIHKSKAFEEFYSSLNSRTKKKMDYIVQVIQDEEVVSTKFVKKIVSSDFYEIRISADNEYRIIGFTIDDDSFIRSSNVLLLNGFMKKSESDYAKQIMLAQNIMKKEGFVNENGD
jgi:phage-related protein